MTLIQVCYLGASYDDLIAVYKEMENWPADDRRPMVVIAHTVKGWWPAAVDGTVAGTKQIIGYPSHPYAFAMNSEYFRLHSPQLATMNHFVTISYRALATSFENRYGVKFHGIHDGVPKSERERLIQFKTNVDVVLSVLHQCVFSHSMEFSDTSLISTCRKGLGKWVANRLLDIAATLPQSIPLSIGSTNVDPFSDARLKYKASDGHVTRNLM